MKSIKLTYTFSEGSCMMGEGVLAQNSFIRI